jgi:hypothetical protein
VRRKETTITILRKEVRKKAGYLYWGKGRDRYWISKEGVSFKADGRKDSGIL